MFESILWVLFTFGCIFVSGLILLQEGKGGGLGEAFGGAGAQTFGVKAQGIAKFTGWAAGALVVLALLITKFRSGATLLPETGPLPAPIDTSAPAEPGAAPATPADGEG